MSQPKTQNFKDKKQLVKYLKNTATIPPAKNISKENDHRAANQASMIHQHKQKVKICQENFGKIGETYILDGAKLRKKQMYEEELNRNRQQMHKKMQQEYMKHDKLEESFNKSRHLKDREFVARRNNLFMKNQDRNLRTEYYKQDDDDYEDDEFYGPYNKTQLYHPENHLFPHRKQLNQQYMYPQYDQFHPYQNSFRNQMPYY